GELFILLAAGFEGDQFLVGSKRDKHGADVEDAAALAALVAVLPQLGAGLGVEAEDVALGQRDADEDAVLVEGGVIAVGGGLLLPDLGGGELVALLFELEGGEAGAAAPLAGRR